MAKKQEKIKKIWQNLKKPKFFLNLHFFLIHSHISRVECLKFSLGYLENQVLHIA